MSKKPFKTEIIPVPDDFDSVNNPSHYLSPNYLEKAYADKEGGLWVEVIDIIAAWNYHKCGYMFNAVKYLLRCHHKGATIQDLNKVKYYVDKKIALLEKENTGN